MATLLPVRGGRPCVTYNVAYGEPLVPASRLAATGTGAKGRSKELRGSRGEGVPRAPRPIGTGTCPVERAVARLVTKTPTRNSRSIPPPAAAARWRTHEGEGELPSGEAVQVVLVVVDEILGGTTLLPKRGL
jgi:hypothetical protein